jgi:hypothetical protein
MDVISICCLQSCRVVSRALISYSYGVPFVCRECREKIAPEVGDEKVEGVVKQATCASPEIATLWSGVPVVSLTKKKLSLQFRYPPTSSC